MSSKHCKQSIWSFTIQKSISVYWGYTFQWTEVILALDFVLCACLHVLFSILDIVKVGVNKCVLVLVFLWTWFNQSNGLNGEKKELTYIFQKYCYYSSAGQWLAFLKTRVDGRNQVVECRQHYLQCTGCTSSNCHQGCLLDLLTLNLTAKQVAQCVSVSACGATIYTSSHEYGLVTPPP